MAATDPLIRLLEAECDLLERLHHRLCTLDHLLAGGATRHLDRAIDDVEAALTEVREEEVLRSLSIGQLIERWGIEVDPTLAQVVDLTRLDDDERAERLCQLRRRLCRLADEVESLSERTRVRPALAERAVPQVRLPSLRDFTA